MIVESAFCCFEHGGLEECYKIAIIFLRVEMFRGLKKFGASIAWNPQIFTLSLQRIGYPAKSVPRYNNAEQFSTIEDNPKIAQCPPSAG